jgi:hypothetical protein
MTLAGRVAPFGDPRINGRSPLLAAFRSVLRPSSPLGAKASTKCPYLALDPKPLSRHTQGQTGCRMSDVRCRKTPAPPSRHRNCPARNARSRLHSALLLPTGPDWDNRRRFAIDRPERPRPKGQAQTHQESAFRPRASPSQPHHRSTMSKTRCQGSGIRCQIPYPDERAYRSEPLRASLDP